MPTARNIAVTAAPGEGVATGIQGRLPSLSRRILAATSPPPRFNRSKDLFRPQALGRIPMLGSSVHTLQAKEKQTMGADFLLGIWENYLSLEQAKWQDATTVDWSLYSKLIENDASAGRFHRAR